jgi:hypothetical protein
MKVNEDASDKDINRFKYIHRVSISTLIEKLLVKNHLKSDLIYRDDPYLA